MNLLSHSWKVKRTRRDRSWPWGIVLMTGPGGKVRAAREVRRLESEQGTELAIPG